MKHPSTIAVAPPLAPTRSRSDSKPWYRQFWPWFLIALPASSVILSFATLYIATTHADTVLPHEGDDSSFSAPRGHEAEPVKMAATPVKMAAEPVTAAASPVAVAAVPAASAAKTDPEAAAAKDPKLP